MSKSFALFNMSGGVGKTTLTQNLGYHLATDFKLKVLLADLDPQASLTTFMGYPPFDYDKTIADSLLNPSSFSLPIEKNTAWCDLVPSNIYLAQCEVELHSKIQRELSLRKVLGQVRDDYDVILVDCPPSLGELSINCISAVDYLIIPIQTEYKSLEATLNLLQTTYEITQAINPGLSVLGVAPTMYREQLVQHRESINEIHSVFESLRENELYAKTSVYAPVPRSTNFGDAARRHQPLAIFKPKHPAIKPIKKIAEDIASRVSVAKETPINV